MTTKSVMCSAVLHAFIIGLMLMDFSLARSAENKTPPALLMVDLTKVQISDKTNLPPKVKKTKPVQAQKKAPPPPQKKVDKVTSTKVKAPAPKPEPPKPKPQPPVKDAAPVIEPKKVEKKEPPKKQEKPKAEPTPPPKTEEKKATAKRYDLKNLLTSVEKVRKNAPPVQTPTETSELPPQNDGIEGGTEGSFSQILTVSERDLIATQLKKCWNVDAGAEGIDNMIVEIRATVNKDGSIRDAKIVNMKSNPAFRSVAESARRAVHICDSRGSFKILAEKYADHYKDWKELFLRFNPLDGGVF